MMQKHRWIITINQNSFCMSSQNFEKQLSASSYLSVSLSVHPHGTTRLTLDGFSRNLIFEYFSKICPEKFKYH